MRLSDLGESSLLELIRDWTGTSTAEVMLGVGDDAALITPSGDRQIVVSTDAFVEGVHFRRDLLAPDEVGYRCMTGALSDLAAMAAVPLAAFVNLHAPADLEIEVLREIYRGMERIAGAHGVRIAGGDTVRGQLALGITALGAVASGEAVQRRGAKPGDVICVTGTLGASEAGRLLLAGECQVALEDSVRDRALRAHRNPTPRFDAIELIRSVRVRTIDLEEVTEDVRPIRPTAMIDVSDGFSRDLHRLCRESEVGAQVQRGWLPIDPASRRVSKVLGKREDALALAGGEDYELLFTIAEEAIEPLLQKARERDLRITPVGKIVPLAAELTLVAGADESEPLLDRGFDHFVEANSGP